MNIFSNWKFVDDVHNAWHWISMKAFAVIAAIPVIWLTIPDDVKNMVPDSWDKWLFLSITLAAIIGGVGRITDQGLPKEPPK